MILKEYQKNAVKELLSNTIKELGKQKESSALVFKAPTGSGKTIMMQNFLKHFCESKIEGEYCFLWISVNDLSRQSKTSFEKNLEGTALHFSELCDIEDKELKANEVLFINWESIRSVDRSTGEWKVLAMKENERNENLPTYLDNTHKSGRKVILIVDESHKSLNTPKAQELIKNYIKPILQIEVSATPDSEGYIPLVEVNIDDVIKEGMIKKEVLVNENLKDLANVEDETDKIVLDLAFKKQKELLSAYKKENSSVKPLVLIQLPSEAKKTTDVDKTKLDRIIHILQEEYDMTFANQKLAIWLSEDKTNKELVDIKDSPVEALIFKQAIATGWDCPRAQILVMFREIQTITFEIQTVGRILRMPEWKHYSSEALNKAYVYTDLPRAEMGVGETAKNLIKNSIGIRNNAIYKDFALQSFYTSRTNYKDIGRSFYSVLAKTFIEYVGGEFSELEKTENTSKLQRFINIEDRDIKSSILSDGEILVDIDNHTGEKIIAKSEIETKTQEELITLSFEDFARNQVGMQFTNVARSYKPIIEALYSALDHYFFGRYKTRLYYQKLILNNKDFFKEVLEKAKNTYKPLRQKEIKEKSKEAEEIYTWQIPRFQGFTKKAKIKEYTKNILQPSYMQLDSQQETWFIEDFLETSEIVEFWYNNGKSTKEFFAVPWEDEYGERRSFYPDFIVHFTNGIIGIFDTKSGFTLKDGRLKAKGLEKYIKEARKTGKKIIGGIIETHKIPNTEECTMRINSIWNYNLNDRSDFSLFNEKYIENFTFENEEETLISEEYKNTLKEKIEELKEDLQEKQKEYAIYLEEREKYDELDYEKGDEIKEEMRKIEKQISEYEIICNF